MAILRERITTPLAIDEAFAFVADFSNSMHWDPGVVTSEALDEGPVRIGSRYRLGVRVRGRTNPMEYRVTAFVPGRRVVLDGEGSGVEATDEITFTTTSTGGTQIDYVADIRLRGLLRLAAPFAARTFARIARGARDGMQRALDDRASAISRTRGAA